MQLAEDTGLEPVLPYKRQEGLAILCVTITPILQTTAFCKPGTHIIRKVKYNIGVFTLPVL